MRLRLAFVSALVLSAACMGQTAPVGTGRLHEVSVTEDDVTLVSWLEGDPASPQGGSVVRAMRFDAAGRPTWNGGSPIAVSGASSRPEDTVLSMTSDGAGGGVLAWLGGSRQAWVQRIDASGAPYFELGGVPASEDGTLPHSACAVAIDPATSETLAAFIARNEERDLESLVVQRFSPAGARLWSKTGRTIRALPIGSARSLSLAETADGTLLAWIERVPGSETDEVVLAAFVDGSQTSKVPATVVSLSSASAEIADLTVTPGELALVQWTRTFDLQPETVSMEIGREEFEQLRREGLDSDGDGLATALDVPGLVEQLGSAVVPGTGFDLDGDGSVTVKDSRLLLQRVKDQQEAGESSGLALLRSGAQPNGLSVQVSVDYASESTSSPEDYSGAFTITRPSATGVLEVPFVLTGTALPALTGEMGDYTLMVGSDRLPKTAVTFADGQSSVEVKIVPIDDGLVEPKETVILTLRAPKGVPVIRKQSRATMSLMDNEPAIRAYIGDIPGVYYEQNADDESTAPWVNVFLAHESAAKYQGPVGKGGRRNLEPVEVLFGSGQLVSKKGDTVATWGKDYEIYRADPILKTWVKVPPGLSATVTVPEDGLELQMRPLKDRELEKKEDMRFRVLPSSPPSYHVPVPVEFQAGLLMDNEPLIELDGFPGDIFGSRSVEERRDGQTRREYFVTLSKRPRESTGLAETSLDGSVVPFTLAGTAGRGSDYRLFYRLSPNDIEEWKPLEGSEVKVPDGDPHMVYLMFQIIDDSDIEDDETVIFTIKGREDLTLGSHEVDTSRGLDGPENQVKFTIKDNDSQTITSVRSSGILLEGSGAEGIFTISRGDDDLSVPLIVPIQIGGRVPGSYSISVNGRAIGIGASEVEIPAGASSVEVRVTVIDDSVRTGDGSLTMSMTKSSKFRLAKGAPTKATLKIIDDDKASPGSGTVFTAQLQPEGQDPFDPASNSTESFKVLVGVYPPRDVTLRLKVTTDLIAGVEYSGIPTEVRFTKGESIVTKVFTFNHVPFSQFVVQQRAPLTISIEPQAGLQLLVPSVTFNLPRQ